MSHSKLLLIFVCFHFKFLQSIDDMRSKSHVTAKKNEFEYFYIIKKALGIQISEFFLQISMISSTYLAKSTSFSIEKQEKTVKKTGILGNNRIKTGLLSKNRKKTASPGTLHSS